MEINVNSRIINLGQSKTNIKEYILNTDFELTDNFVSFPFGSTRTRFQHDELFKFDLTNINVNKYKLTVTKKKITSKNCPQNSEYFNGEGWTLNLRVINLKTYDVTKEFLSENELKRLIPEKYGDIELHVPSNYVCPNVGIVTPVFSRHEYLERFLNSLNNTNLSGCVLVIVDESMTKDINDDKIKVRDLIKNYHSDTCVVIKIYKKKSRQYV